MMSNDAYYEGFTQNDLDFRMQKTGASMEEYKAFAKEQVIDFTDEQKKIIDEHMGRIEEIIAEKGYTIPEMEQIVFHCITRCDRDFRSEMYQIIGFTSQDEDFAIPETL